MVEHPRPSPSPRPPAPPLDEPQTDPYLRLTLDREANKLTWRSVLIAGSTLITGLVAAIVFIDNRVQAQTDAGVRVHEERITTLEHQQTELRSDVHEVQIDVRALYKAVMTGRPQERLEKPPPAHDGGQ